MWDKTIVVDRNSRKKRLPRAVPGWPSPDACWTGRHGTAGVGGVAPGCYRLNVSGDRQTPNTPDRKRQDKIRDIRQGVDRKYSQKGNKMAQLDALSTSIDTVLTKHAVWGKWKVNPINVIAEGRQCRYD